MGMYPPRPQRTAAGWPAGRADNPLLIKIPVQ